MIGAVAHNVVDAAGAHGDDELNLRRKLPLQQRHAALVGVQTLAGQHDLIADAGMPVGGGPVGVFVIDRGGAAGEAVFVQLSYIRIYSACYK